MKVFRTKALIGFATIGLAANAAPPKPAAQPLLAECFDENIGGLKDLVFVAFEPKKLVVRNFGEGKPTQILLMRLDQSEVKLGLERLKAKPIASGRKAFGPTMTHCGSVGCSKKPKGYNSSATSLDGEFDGKAVWDFIDVESISSKISKVGITMDLDKKAAQRISLKCYPIDPTEAEYQFSEYLKVARETVQ